MVYEEYLSLFHKHHQMTGFLIHRLQTFYHLQHPFQVNIFYLYFTKEEMEAWPREIKLFDFLGPQSSHCQSQMFSDLSVVFLAHSTLLYTLWVSVWLFGFCHFLLLNLQIFQNASSPSLYHFTPQGHMVIWVSDSSSTVHINLWKIHIQFTVCILLSTHLNC